MTAYQIQQALGRPVTATQWMAFLSAAAGGAHVAVSVDNASLTMSVRVLVPWAGRCAPRRVARLQRKLYRLIDAKRPVNLAIAEIVVEELR